MQKYDSVFGSGHAADGVFQLLNPRLIFPREKRYVPVIHASCAGFPPEMSVRGGGAVNRIAES